MSARLLVRLQRYLLAVTPAVVAACGGGGGESGQDAVAPVPTPGVVQNPPTREDEPPLAPPAEEPAPPGDDPPPSDPPAEIPAPARYFDLSRWKLTLPSGLEVQNAVLVADYQQAGVFYTDPETRGMVFRTPNIGGTTANSSFSRTELREMLAPGRPAYVDANNWTPAVGGVLRATLRIDHVSTTGDPAMTGRLIIGQIHGPTTEVVRLYYQKKPADVAGRIYASMEAVAGTTTRATIVDNANGGGIPLGQRFDYVIELRGLDLAVTVTRPDGVEARFTRTIDPAYTGLNLYFKAGVYNQNNTGDPGDYAQATFFNLTQAH